MSDFRTVGIAVYNRAADLPAEVAAFSRGCFGSPKWLSAFEGWGGLSMQPFHLVHSTNGVADALIPAYTEYESLCGTFSERLFGRLSHIRTLSKWLAERTLVCTSPWSFQSSILSPSHPDEAFMLKVLNGIEETAAEKRFQCCAFTYVPESSAGLRKGLQRAGYREFPNCPTTKLDLKFNSFDQYVNHLKSRGARSSIRSERKKGAGLPYVWFEGASLSADINGRPLHAILMDLHNKTWKKHNRNSSPLDPQFIAEIWKNDRENMRLCLGMQGPRVIAFSFLRLTAAAAHVFMVGKDDRLAKHHSAYFNVLFYEPITRGIQEGWRTIFYRPGTYFAKHRRGCHIERLYLYVKVFNPVIDNLLSAYMALARRYFQDKYLPPRLYAY